MIKTEINRHTAIVTIDHPAKKNALSRAMWDELGERFREIPNNKDIRLILLRGAGENFCAGADISEFDRLRDSDQRASEYEASNSRCFSAIRNCPIPTLAAIKGVCFGGGFGIAAACDLRIAQEGARFCVPAGRLGLAYPVDAMADIVNALGEQFAKQLLFSARILKCQEALNCGFLIARAKKTDFENEVQKQANEICANAPLSNIASKQAIKAVLSGYDRDYQLAVELGKNTFASDDYAEGRVAFAQKRKPKFQGR